MNRKLAIAAVIAAFAFTVQAADAKSHRHGDKKKLAAVAIGVGVASTAAYYGIGGWSWDSWNYSSGLTRAGAWGVTTMGCAALSPIVATAVLNRPLSYREAHILVGSCVIPIVGGWLVNEAYKSHMLWAPDEQVAERHHHRHAK